MAGDDPDRFTSDPEELTLLAIAWKAPTPVSTGSVRQGASLSHTRTRKALGILEERGHVARHDAPVPGGQFGWVLTDLGREVVDAWYDAHPGAAR